MKEVLPMFTLITVTAVPGFFSRAGEAREVRFHAGKAAADVLRYALVLARKPLYKAVGIRVGDRHNSRVMWVK